MDPVWRGVQHVLVVEDDEVAAAAIRAALRAEGYEVSLATSTSDAQDVLLEREQLTAVVCDLNLEERGDGLEVLRGSRRKHPGAARILISGDPGATAAIALGLAHRVIMKPIDPADVVRVVGLLVRSHTIPSGAAGESVG